MGVYEPQFGQHEKGYFCELYGVEDGTNEFRLAKHIDVGYEIIDSIEYDWQPDNYYYMRLSVKDNEIKAKVWEEGETEPSSWTIEKTETKSVEKVDETTSDFSEGTLTDVVATEDSLQLDKDSNGDYYATGTREQPQIDVTELDSLKEAVINWEEVLNGQTIIVEISIDGGDWEEIEKGQRITQLDSNSSTLDIRQTLETDDNDVTPILKKLTVTLYPFYYSEGIIGIGNFNHEGDRYYDFIGIGWLGNPAPKEDFNV